MRKHHKAYYVWKHIRQRCNNPRHKNYALYGERGIRVCARWDDFNAFVADMGERPEGMSIERKDVNGNYCKENCVWATQKEQTRNTRVNRQITLNGVTKPLCVWCEELGISYWRVHMRLRRGWPLDQVFKNVKYRSRYDRTRQENRN